MSEKINPMEMNQYTFDVMDHRFTLPDTTFIAFILPSREDAEYVIEHFTNKHPGIMVALHDKVPQIATSRRGDKGEGPTLMLEFIRECASEGEIEKKGIQVRGFNTWEP